MQCVVKRSLWGVSVLLLCWACTTGNVKVGDGEDAGSDASVPGDGSLTDGGDDGGTVSDGGEDPDGGTDPDGGIIDGDECVGIGGLCQSNPECCGGRVCQADGSGVKRCVDTTFCKGEGETCTQASECCSLACVSGTCQGSEGLCLPEGESCETNADCCSNICNETTELCDPLGDGCKPMGERCSTEGEDAACCSNWCMNLGTDSEPDLRCYSASTCGARGEICVDPSDCCSGACIDGRCPTQNLLGSVRTVGEPCTEDSDCASYACAALFVGGPKTCQFLGGCRPASEICTEAWQCCGYTPIAEPDCLPSGNDEEVCEAQEIATGVFVSRCELQVNAKEKGEICREGDGVTAVHDCCGGADYCVPSNYGVWRCRDGNYDPNDPQCLPDGAECKVNDECCNNRCVPVDDGGGVITLRCGSACVEDGGGCTTNNDCCSSVCVNGVCEGGEEEAPECLPLGADCTSHDACCSGNCSTSTHTCTSVLG